MSNQRSRGWCFTINNYTEEDEFLANEVCEDSSYGVIGYEIGENEQTPHLQCYVHYRDAKSFRTMKALLPRAHIEKARGTPSQNRKYCIKEGDFVEYGEIPGDPTPVTEAVVDMIHGRQELTSDRDSLSRFLLTSSEEDNGDDASEEADGFDLHEFNERSQREVRGYTSTSGSSLRTSTYCLSRHPVVAGRIRMSRVGIEW